MIYKCLNSTFFFLLAMSDQKLPLFNGSEGGCLRIADRPRGDNRDFVSGRGEHFSVPQHAQTGSSALPDPA